MISAFYLGNNGSFFPVKLFQFFSPGYSILYGVTVSELDVVKFREACSELDNSINSKYFAG